MFLEILTISIALGSLAASYFLRPKAQTPVTPQPEDPKYPTVEEGDPIPVVFGTVQIDRPQLLWYGNVEIVPVKDFLDATTGYAYNAWFSYGLCLGQLDRLVAFLVDGIVQTLESINVADSVAPQKKRFVCETKNDRGYSYRRQGYITLGEPTTGQNAGVGYLINANTGSYGGLVPGHFGMAVAELGPVYVGQSPYPQTFSFRVQRIHKLLTGETQWNDSYAEIPAGRNWWEAWENALVPASDATEYQDPAYDVSVAWGPPEVGAFGNTDIGILSIGTTVGSPSLGDKLWVRGDLGPIEMPVMAIMLWHSSKAAGDTLALWWNGQSVTIISVSDNFSYALVDADTIDQGGTNMVAFRVTQGSGDGNIFAGMAVVASDATIDTYDPGWSSDNQISMNPAHIIREVLTNPTIGLGYLDADIDDTSFYAAAATLYQEKFGLSLNWDKSVEIGEFIGTILKHIDARLYVDRTTGKFTLKLVRQDYTVGDLLVLDETNVVSVENATRRATGELVNSVRVEYQNSLSGDKGSVTVHDPGLIQAQGQVLPTKIEYPGITTYALAARVALRDLRVLSSRLLTCSIPTNRETADLNLGDAFVLTWGNLGLSGQVMRVIGIDLGDGLSNQVTIQAVEDAFSTPSFSTVGKSTARWLNPSQDPPPASFVFAYDATYWDLKRYLGESDTNALINLEDYGVNSLDNGHIMVAVVQPTGAINASLYSKMGSEDYAGKGIIDFCPSMQLAAPILISDTVVTYTNESNLGGVVAGNLIAICSATDGVKEICRVDIVDEANSQLTLGRGCLDTVPVAHEVAGTYLMYLGNFVARDTTPRDMNTSPPYTYTNPVDFKVCPRNTRGEALLAEAPVTSLSLIPTRFSLGLDSALRRAYRPFPPGNLKVNDVWFPEYVAATGDLVISFAWRSRLNPNVYDFTAGSSGPEASARAVISIYDRLGTDNSWDAIEGETVDAPSTSWTLTNAMEIAGRNAVGKVDASFASVSCLLHMDGPNGGRDIFDSGPLGINFSMLGTAALTTAAAKFGGASFNPGTKGATTWTLAPFQFGSGDFTVEAWVYLPSEVSARGIILSHKVGDTGSGVVSWMFTIADTRELQFWWSTSGSGFAGSVRQRSSAIPLATWTHVAFVRSGTVGTLYVNGYSTGPGGVIWQTGQPDQSASITGTLYAASAPVCVGVDGDGTRPLQGYIDDVRVTKGVARTITVPTLEFPQGSYGLAQMLRMTVQGKMEGPFDDDSSHSFHQHDWHLRRAGYGGNYGYLYGGHS